MAESPSPGAGVGTRRSEHTCGQSHTLTVQAHRDGGPEDSRAHPCARLHQALLLIEDESLFSGAATQLCPGVMHRKRLAIGRYHTMNASNGLAVLLQLKIPRVRVDLLRECAIHGSGVLLHFLTIAVLHAVRPFLAVGTGQFLLERVHSFGLGIDTSARGQLVTVAELGLLYIEFPRTHDRISSQRRAGDERPCKHQQSHHASHGIPSPVVELYVAMSW